MNISNSYAKKGQIFNNSQFLIEYYIYERLNNQQEQLINTSNVADSSFYIPNGKKAQINGIQPYDELLFKRFYNCTKAEVHPLRNSSVGLIQVQLGIKRITVVAIIKNPNPQGKSIQKILFQNVPIKCINDVRIKIRSDLSVKNLAEKQFMQLTIQSQEATKPQGDPNIIQKKENQRSTKIISQIISNSPNSSFLKSTVSANFQKTGLKKQGSQIMYKSQNLNGELKKSSEIIIQSKKQAQTEKKEEQKSSCQVY